MLVKGASVPGDFFGSQECGRGVLAGPMSASGKKKKKKEKKTPQKRKQKTQKQKTIKKKKKKKKIALSQSVLFVFGKRLSIFRSASDPEESQ